MGADILTTLQHQVEDEGLVLGTPRYEFRLLTLKVEKCMEMQSVTLCSACRAYLGCEMTKEHQRWKRFGPPKVEK
jgi:hypothetical protein